MLQHAREGQMRIPRQNCLVECTGSTAGGPLGPVPADGPGLPASSPAAGTTVAVHLARVE